MNKIEIDLQAAKEENERLNKKVKSLQAVNKMRANAFHRDFKTIEQLTQQNKQMRELINEINLEYFDDGILSKATKYAIQQLFKGVE